MDISFRCSVRIVILSDRNTFKLSWQKIHFQSWKYLVRTPLSIGICVLSYCLAYSHSLYMLLYCLVDHSVPVILYVFLSSQSWQLHSHFFSQQRRGPASQGLHNTPAPFWFGRTGPCVYTFISPFCNSSLFFAQQWPFTKVFSVIHGSLSA